MKSILLVVPSWEHGGTNRCMQNICQLIDRDKYRISILSMNTSGPYKNMLPKETIRHSDIRLSAIATLKNKGLSNIGVLIWKFVYKTVFRGQEHSLFKFAAQKYNKQHFDIVIAFQEGRATNFCRYVEVKHRIAWVHCDYSNYHKLTDYKDETGIYQCYDDVVCVSDYTAQVFCNTYPALSEKVHGIHNMIDNDGIISASQSDPVGMDKRNGEIVFVSVGRMDAVKRFSSIPMIAKRMNEAGIQFKWYIIGSGGNEFELVRNGIQEYGVDDAVVLLGTKDNPYPYIAASDALVCLSYSEACPNVVNEAKILHVPVITTNYPSAEEFVRHEQNGLITPIEKLADELIRFCQDEQLRDGLKKGISSFEYDNSRIMRRIEALFEK